MTSREPRLSYATDHGTMYNSSIEDFLLSDICKKNIGQIQLIFTSPPYPLNRKKRYGNKLGDEYRDWITNLFMQMMPLLKTDGSLVIELGNAWDSGQPTMSTLVLRTLLDILDTTETYLCQQFIVYNPARLPSPAQWVNIERIRVKDAYTHVWWLGKTTRPKADNRRVLTGYSEAMKRLLKNQAYNGGPRPSQHQIGSASFLTDNGGSIPPNVLTISNTSSNDDYRRFCLENEIAVHPARMPPDLAHFFIQFLTDPGDTVFDPFAGSNTTGYAAQSTRRHWISVERSEEYVAGSVGRFPSKTLR